MVFALFSVFKKKSKEEELVRDLKLLHRYLESEPKTKSFDELKLISGRVKSIINDLKKGRTNQKDFEEYRNQMTLILGQLNDISSLASREKNITNKMELNAIVKNIKRRMTRPTKQINELSKKKIIPSQ